MRVQVRYVGTLIRRTGSGDEVRRKTSKRNILTYRNRSTAARISSVTALAVTTVPFPPGSYSAFYKAQLRRGRRVVAQTGQSPSNDFILQ